MRYQTWTLLVVLLGVGCSGDPRTQPAQETPGSPVADGGSLSTPTPADWPAPQTPNAAPSDRPPDAVLASVVYGQAGDGSLRGIFTDGITTLLADPGRTPQDLLWSASPDGGTIAVIIVKGRTIKTGGFEQARLWLVDSDATDPRMVLDLGGSPPGASVMAISSLGTALTNQEFQRLSWTPDSQTMIVTSAHEGQADLYAVPARGGAPRRLTATPEFEIDVYVSPAGSHIAYTSVEHFGTGGGWGDPLGWTQPLDGEPTLILTKPEFSFISTLGWINPTTSIAVTFSQDTAQYSSIWAVEIGGEPQLLSRSPALITTDLIPGRLAFALTDRELHPEVGDLYVWGGDDTEPTLVTGEVSEVSLGPQLLILLCTRDARALWHDGTRSDLGMGSCDNAAWSRSGRLALGGPSSMIVGPDGGVAELTMPAQALIAGWLDEVVYFFAPVEAGWQLYQLDTSQQAGPQPLGAPAAEQPIRPALVQVEP